MTGIEAKHYPTDVYNGFTSAQKAKHWQLMNPGKTPETGPAKGARGGTGATASGMTNQIATATSITDFRAATQKRAANDKESDLTGDSEWGCDRDKNHGNPALGCQDSATKKPKN